MTEPPALEFHPLPEHVAIDVDAVLAGVPPTSTNKRLFIDAAMQLVADRLSPTEIFARAGVVVGASEPFDDVPWHDYFRVVVVVAELLRGPEQLGVGLREVGRCFYPSLLDTVVGPMLLGRHLGEALRKAADIWQQFTPVGKIWSEFRGEREFHFHFEGYLPVLVESVGAGTFEGLFRHHHMPVDLQLAQPTPSHTVVRLRW